MGCVGSRDNVHSDAYADTHSGADAYPHADTHPGADADPHADTHPGADAYPHTDTYSGADPDPDSYAHTDSVACWPEGSGLLLRPVGRLRP